MHMAVPMVAKEIGKHVAWLEKCLKATDSDLDGMIRQSPAWQYKVALMTSVPGMGRVTAIALLAQLPELGTQACYKRNQWADRCMSLQQRQRLNAWKAHNECDDET